MYGERIRHFRKQKGLSQAEMANRLHMSPATYSKIETNYTNLLVEILGKIAEILEICPLAIMKDEPTVTNSNDNTNNNEKVNTWINAETFFKFQKEFIDIIVKSKDSEISTLKQSIENQQNIIQQLMLRK